MSKKKFSYKIDGNIILDLEVDGQNCEFFYRDGTWFRVIGESISGGKEFEEVKNSIIRMFLEEKRNWTAFSMGCGGSGLGGKECEKFLGVLIDCSKKMFEKFFQKGMSGKCGWDDEEWAKSDEWAESFDKHVRKAGYNRFENVDDLIDLMNFVTFRINALEEKDGRTKKIK